MFKKKMEIKKHEQFMTLFAEGKISVYDFWGEFCKNKELQSVIYNDKKLPIKNKPFLYDDLDLNKMYHRCEIYRVIKVYFLRRNVQLNFYNEDSKIYSQLLNLIPRYVDADDWLINNIVNKCPYKLDSKEGKNFIKKAIKEKYNYISTPPIWLQSPEWAYDGNGPLTFVKQSIRPNNMTSETIDIEYTFVDLNQKEVIVKQYT